MRPMETRFAQGQQIAEEVVDMLLKELFTEYDDSIEANAYRDPMGLQIIWSAVGQNIFGRNITSISSDMRNFNINLFNHWIVKDLTSGVEALQLSQKQKEHYSGVGLKTGLIIFLENLMVYLMLSESNGEPKVADVDVDLGGLLGTSKARNRLDNDGLEGITLSVDQEDTILVRQISLGINGRYRTPFVEAGLMDVFYNYEPYDDAWKEASVLFSSNGYAELAGRLKSALQGLFAAHPNQTPPEIAVTAISEMKEIQAGFARCFGTRESTRAGEFRSFWRRRLKLDQGAAAVLYDCAKLRIGSDNVSIQEVAHAALESIPEDSEDHRKIDDIRKLEPFLVSANALFRLICAKEVETLDDLREALHEKEAGDLLDRLRAQADQAHEVEPNIGGFSQYRLQRLTQFNCDDLSRCVEDLQRYQSEVMEQRGNNAWFTFDGTHIKHNVREYEKRTVDFNNRWENGYYIDSMISLCRGLEEAQVEADQ